MYAKRATRLPSRLASAVRTWLQRRREFVELSQMNYRDLKDLGFPTALMAQEGHRDGDPRGSLSDVRRIVGPDCTNSVQVSRWNLQQ